MTKTKAKSTRKGPSPEPAIGKHPPEHGAARAPADRSRASDLFPSNHAPAPHRATALMRVTAPAAGSPRRSRMMKGLQHTAGNTRISRMLGEAIQPKLTVSAPGEAHEREADEMANQVMHMPVGTAPRRRLSPSERGGQVQRVCGCTTHGGEGCPECNKKRTEEKIHRQDVDGGQVPIEPDVESRVQHLRGGGQPLPESVRRSFEPRFGEDFSDVRIHIGSEASHVARHLDARAFTIGRDVIFGAGQFAPETGEGQKLMAHELTHVAQQSPTVSSASTVQRQVDGGGDSNQGSGPITVTLPETVIVATPPARLRSAIGRSDYYVQRAGDFAFRNPGIPSPSYYLQYGNKYVNLFTAVLRPNLSADGKAWLDCTLVSLQAAIEDQRDANPWAFAELERDDGAFQNFAFGTHPNAYVSCGLCNLSILDEARIGLTPDAMDLLTLGGLRQIIDTLFNCQPAWFYPVGPPV